MNIYIGCCVVLLEFVNDFELHQTEIDEYYFNRVAFTKKFQQNIQFYGETRQLSSNR